jgi:hypothetical protein
MGTTAAALYISSDDENDASDNNAVVVAVEALDSNWDPVTISAPLGAASAGGTVFAQIGTETLLRINRMYVTSTTAPAGNIYAATDTEDGNADGIPDDIANQFVAGITIGENQTLQACYTVPNNFQALLTQFCLSNQATAGSIQFRLRRSVEGAASRTAELQILGTDLSNCFYHDPPLFFDEKTDIEITGLGAAVNNDAAATFDLVVVPE